MTLQQCIYAVLKSVIMYVDENTLPEGVFALAHILQRQVSYFADPDGFDGLLRHLGDDSPWCQVLKVLLVGFDKDNPREPFTQWMMEPLDSDFKDLIGGLTNLDPAKRLTADEALLHKWFEDARAE